MNISENNSKTRLEEAICIHIFTVPATMVGVCLTVIGIVNVAISIKKVSTITDHLSAVNALIFLTSCLLSYWALRANNKQRMYQVERIADAVFLIGLTSMVVLCGLIVLALAYALGHLPASIVAPTMVMQTVVTALLAIPLLGETPNIWQGLWRTAHQIHLSMFATVCIQINVQIANRERS